MPGHEADRVYGDARLIVELDGRAYHERRAQMRADRNRDMDHQLAGFSSCGWSGTTCIPAEAAATARKVRRMLVAGEVRAVLQV